MREREKVLWLAKGLGPGGMERLLVNHAAFGDRERFAYEAAYIVERPNSVVGELEALGVPCTRLGTGRDTDVRWIADLRSRLARGDVSILHAHSPAPAAVGRVVARTVRPRPRLVYTEHNSWDCYGRATRWANAATFGLDDATVAVSGQATASIPPRLRRAVEVLVHGIDVAAVRRHLERRAAVRAELGVGRDTVVVTTVANHRVEKAYDVLLPAARRVLDRHPDVVFLCVGHGPLEATARRLHQELRLGDSVRLLGFRSDALDLLAGSDVFLLASRQEGLPVSLMEALALGLPVVSTAVGGIPEVVEHGRDALLVAPERPDVLADAVGELVTDRELAARLAAAARSAASAFDVRAAAGRLDAIYRGLLG